MREVQAGGVTAVVVRAVVVVALAVALAGGAAAAGLDLGAPVEVLLPTAPAG